MAAEAKHSALRIASNKLISQLFAVHLFAPGRHLQMPCSALPWARQRSWHLKCAGSRALPSSPFLQSAGHWESRSSCLSMAEVTRMLTEQIKCMIHHVEMVPCVQVCSSCYSGAELCGVCDCPDQPHLDLLPLSCSAVRCLFYGPAVRAHS
jgi:hypothetical protein